MSSLGLKPQPDIAQACMRPCPPDALPYLGAIPGTTNATWPLATTAGASWAPVTGTGTIFTPTQKSFKCAHLLVSRQVRVELILDGRSKCGFKAFDPGRFSKRLERKRHGAVRRSMLLLANNGEDKELHRL